LIYFNIDQSGISVKETYKNQLAGKVTIPTSDASGNLITKINDFSRCSRITHIFFLPTAKYVEINSEAGFGNCQSLKYIELPVSITKIGNSAFANNSALTMTSLNDNIIDIGSSAFDTCQSLNWTSLPANLTVINERSFCLCSGLKLDLLPRNITEVKSAGFKFSSNVNIKVFGHTKNAEMGAEDNMITRIESDAFNGCGQSVNEIWIKNSVEELLENCFLDYGKSN
jgi:hypothetical protein